MHCCAGFGAALELRSNCLKLSQPVEGKSPQQDFLGQGPELNSESSSFSLNKEAKVPAEA